MSVDNLTVSSRDFYERSKLKTALGLYFGAVSCMFMGMCCQAGGEASSNDKMSTYYEDNNGNDDLINSYDNAASGYGFASFCYILACVLTACISIYVCVPLCGSETEKKTLQHPVELESVGSTHSVHFGSGVVAGSAAVATPVVEDRGIDKQVV